MAIRGKRLLARFKQRPAGRCRLRAFTLVETLVVLGLIALLLSLLLPALNAARGRMKMLKCSSNMRTIAFNFQLFAEDETPEGRRDGGRYGRNGFAINDFQDYLYGTSAFWGNIKQAAQVLRPANAEVLCPAGAPQLVKHRGFPCGNEAVSPVEDVSLAVNMRLYSAVVEFMNRKVLAPAAATHVRSDALSHPYAPLMLDVDGKRAGQLGRIPFYTAPPLVNGDGPYSQGDYWMPSQRHVGRTNVVFIGGHVLSSKHPEKEAWDWKYQAQVGG